MENIENVFKKLSRLTLTLILGLLFLVLFSGCSSGGGGGGTASDPAEGSNWDEMVWDQGTWG